MKENRIDEISLALGVSIGGVVLLELLNYKDIKINRALFEGCSLWQNAGVLELVVRNIFRCKQRKAIKNKELANEKMKSIYGEAIGRVMAQHFTRIDVQSIKNICHDCAFVNLPKLSEEEQKRCIFCYGSKEFDLKCARRVIPQKYPYATLKMWDRQSHCTKITTNTAEYCEMLKTQID